ncbi:hypothetical protein ACOSQ4_027257 [Xanthoceras sorbifolium]
MRQTPLGFITSDSVPTASPQPPLITPQTEMSTQDVDQAGRVTPLGGNHRGNTDPNKETLSRKRCASKGKELLLLSEPFSSESFSQSTGNSQTKKITACSKRKHR